VDAPGIVRPARRPPGWRPPGPRPAVPDDAIRLGPRANEDLCFLAGDWRIFQRTDGHRWSLDDLVTAWGAARETADAPPASVLDLGCGIGAVLMLLAWRFPSAVAVGIEAQAVSVDLARRSLAWNGIADRCTVLHGDLRDASVLPAGATFALVTATPPYLRPGAATASPRVQRGPCHVAVRGGIEAYCVAAARWMAPGALFVTCEAAASGARVEAAAAAAGLGLERRIDVVPRAGKPALFSVWAMRRGAGASGTVVETPLVVRDAAGGRTDAFRAVRRAFGMPP
jgi:tRNA1Val (adenine37-N6)-methyltransferase